MNFVKWRAWLCLAIGFQAAPLAQPQNVITDSAASAKLAISPANPRLLKNSPLQFIATFQDKIKEKGVLWTSSNPGVATIDSQGSATLLGPGTSTITATRETQQASTLLTVTTANNPIFSGQPGDTDVSAVIDAGTGVQIQLLDNLGGPLAGQSITLSIGTNPPGTGVLMGTLIQTTDVTGTATFPDLRIDWFGSGYTLIAAANPVSGAVAGTSAGFTERRVGDPCLGPNPACSSSCPDSDGDGLNDAWEIAGGIDMNGDGKIDAQHDLLLPGADPAKQDVYVQYDWMDYSTSGNACSTTADCQKISFAHTDETCTGPQVLPTAPGSCVFACTTDADCTSRRFSGQASDKCISNVCQHTHDPDLLAPDALPSVVNSFADHGINLHLIRGHALPHSLVVSFRQNAAMTDACEGGSLASGTAGMGKYAESLYDLKAGSSLDKLKIAYHYTVFGHYSGCDSFEDCNRCPPAANPDGSPKNAPVFEESGLAEVSGNDFIVSLGALFQDLHRTAGVFNVGSTFMHELGHNLGLRHGGGVDTPCESPGAACPGGGFCTTTAIGNYCLSGEDINAKPNYLSVMNYRYQFTGIQSSGIPGSSVPDPNLTRLDYSNQVLPAGGNTPGFLDQSTAPDSPAVGDPGLGLSEPAGLGSGVADIFTFTSSRETGIPSAAASDGPVDWDGDADLGEMHVQADTNCGPAGFADHSCSVLQYPQLRGHADWGPAGQNQFTYKFQCTPFAGPTGDGSSPAGRVVQHELSAQAAMDMHLAQPIAGVGMIIRSGCSTKAVALGQGATVQVAVLGSQHLNVNDIEPSSLRLHGAHAVSVSAGDVNQDGIPDLLLEFSLLDMHLSPHARRARLTGWLKNGQLFIGEDQITDFCGGPK